MKVVQVDRNDPDPAAIETAAAVIRSGGIVAFPTETVYGLGGNALDREAIARIYEAKGRPAYNPLIVHCADIRSARDLAGEWPDAAERLGSAFWPGPLTLVVPKSSVVPDAVTAGLPTVALRVPDHPVARALLRASGVPIAAPSANRYREISPTTAEHVSKGLAEQIDLLLDGGPCDVGIESTVIDLSGPEPRLLRPGSYEPDRLATLLGTEFSGPARYEAGAARPGPGMIGHHYSPRATVVLVSPGDRTALSRQYAHHAGGSARVGAILRTIEPLPGMDVVVDMPSAPGEYARLLYATLHRMDDEDIDVVLIEAPPSTGAWAGVRDRLNRAAAPKA
jgi:L-threonylcarbamoyladenylate synthase